MLVTKDGIVVRTRVDQISLIGRNTQGVTVMKVGEGDQVASIAAFRMSDPSRRRTVIQADGSEVEIEDEDEPAPNGNGHSDEQVLNETIPLVLDEDEEAGGAEDEE